MLVIPDFDGNRAERQRRKRLHYIYSGNRRSGNAASGGVDARVRTRR